MAVVIISGDDGKPFCSLTFDETKPFFWKPPKIGPGIRGGFYQTATKLAEIKVVPTGGEPKTKPIPPVKKSGPMEVATVSLSIPGATLLMHASYGTRPSEPSLAFTIQSKPNNEMAGCSKCHAIFKMPFTLSGDAPKCPACKKKAGKK